jgi:hypothetical protein
MVWVTTFTDVYADSWQGEDLTLDDLAKLIRNTTASQKAALPLLKLARFGLLRTVANSLRHDANVTAVSGIEADYDGESMPFQEAVDRLEAAGFAFIAYTSPSHTPTKPRWRVLAPFSRELPAEDRARMLNRLNGVLGGVLSGESWCLSQSYFFGIVDGAAAETHVGDDEQCVNEADDLDATAQPHRPTSAAPGAMPDFDKLDEPELLELIQTGQHYFRPARRLLEMWARQGITENDAQSNLESAFDAVPVGTRDKKWRKGRGAIPRWIQKTYARILKQPQAYLRGLVTYLTEERHWRGAVRLNKFSQTIEVCVAFPPQPGQSPGPSYRALLDPEDVLEALMCVQENGFPRAGKSTVRDALVVAAAHNGFHPVEDWLTGLRWDGQDRISRLFIDYFHGELPPDPGEQRDNMVAYLEKVAECFMVGAVARIFQPGCKLDTLPVLVGAQGYNKSQGLQALVPDPAWFSDDMSTSLIDRDTKESLVGKWIVELAEFPHIRKEIERVKGFFSRQVDRFRRAYDRSNRDWSRQNAFIASANELEFIDTTGNRRFWPVPMNRPADVAAIARDREQLWAEAVHRYREGFEWWLSPNLEEIAREMQDAFLEDDVWDAPIGDWIDNKALRDRKTGEVLPFTTRDVLRGIGYAHTPGEEDKQMVATKADQMRAANCLKRLGYRRDTHPRRVQGRRDRCWTSQNR